jgi:DNA uptake protein ComE-like DNA-binding protein
MKRRHLLPVVFGISTLLVLQGCSRFQGQPRSEQSQQSSDERTREKAADATERAKRETTAAVKELNDEAEALAHKARVAAQGIKQGWNTDQHPVVDVNEASEHQLLELPGVSTQDAHKIIQARPYRDKHDLVSKGVISDDLYSRIEDRITAK